MIKYLHKNDTYTFGRSCDPICTWLSSVCYQGHFLLLLYMYPNVSHACYKRCTKSWKFTIFSKTLSTSRNTEAKLSLFELIWMHFTYWIQIWQWNYEFTIFGWKIETWSGRLLLIAAWKRLILDSIKGVCIWTTLHQCSFKFNWH